MVRYKSRIGPGGSVKKRAPAKRTRRRRGGNVAGTPVQRDGVTGGGQRDDFPAPGDDVTSGDVVTQGGALRSGGAVSSGGALGSGGVLSEDVVDKLSYPQVYHILGHMKGGEFHTLQGLAAAHLPDEGHPLKRPIMESLGGSFVHPMNISKVATKDVLKAPTSQMLSQAVYQEYLDSLSGRDTGGGLFDSIKNLFRRSSSAAKKGIAAGKKGIKTGIAGASKGLQGAVNIGKKLNDAVVRGTEIAKSFQEPISALAPGFGEKLKSGIDTAEQISSALKTGVDVGEFGVGGLEVLGQIADENF